MISPPWGFFALVSYVPDPLGTCLDGLTQALPGMEFRQAHITILPPRPLRLPVEEATRHTRRVLDLFSSFEIRLGAVQRFPATNVLYLDLTEGLRTIHEIHDALNSGDLAFEEQFEFHPHLTLAGPLVAEDLDKVQYRAERLWHAIEPKEKFAVREIVGLWAEPGQKQLSWQRLWVHRLRSDHSRSARVGVTGQTS